MKLSALLILFAIALIAPGGYATATDQNLAQAEQEIFRLANQARRVAHTTVLSDDVQ